MLLEGWHLRTPISPEGCFLSHQYQCPLARPALVPVLIVLYISFSQFLSAIGIAWWLEAQLYIVLNLEWCSDISPWQSPSSADTPLLDSSTAMITSRCLIPSILRLCVALAILQPLRMSSLTATCALSILCQWISWALGIFGTYLVGPSIYAHPALKYHFVNLWEASEHCYVAPHIQIHVKCDETGSYSTIDALLNTGFFNTPKPYI